MITATYPPNIKTVTVIVPLYNEEKRAPAFLKELIEFCKDSSDKLDIVFVNDGSTDNTLQILQPYVSNYEFVHLISYSPNMGKGFAVKKAVLESDAEFILFIDADGSISPTVIKQMLQKMEKFDVVAGSRALKDSIAIQHPFRKLIGVIFNIITNAIFWTGIQDNLCGVKCFNKKAAHTLFGNLKTNRWIFDVELFFKIKKEKLSLYQMPIYWVYKSDSKIKIYDPVIMLFDLIILRIKLFAESFHH